MSVCGQFFELLGSDYNEGEKAFEAPEDVAAGAIEDADALDEAAREVDSTAESGNEPVEETSSADINSDDSEEELTEDEFDDPDSVDLEEEEGEYPDEESDMTPNDDDAEADYIKRVNVFKNTQQLLDIVIQNRESFELRFGKGLTPELTKEYRLITRNFDDFITVARTALSEKYGSGSYNALVKYHVSLTKVYDIIVRMIENFVKKYDEEIEN